MQSRVKKDKNIHFHNNQNVHRSSRNCEKNGFDINIFFPKASVYFTWYEHLKYENNGL